MDINSDNYAQFYWSVNNQNQCNTNCTTLTVAPDQTTSYEAVIITASGLCEYRANTKVIVLQENKIYTPNIFQPDLGSGNESFEIFSPQFSEVLNYSIFDRWGNLVFYSTESLRWDGRYQNSPAETGVYVYKAVVQFVDNTQATLSGTFTLLR